MIERKRENFILNKAKNADDAVVSASIFNVVQDKIFRLQPINEFLNNFNIKKVEKKPTYQDLKHTVDQLLATNKVLHQEIEERKKVALELEKSKAELQTALEKNQDLGNLKTRFITMASHEFRTPLSTILSSTELIRKYDQESDQDKREKHTDRIIKCVNNLNNMLNDFLSIKKLEDEIIDPRPSHFYLFSVCKEVTDDLEKSLKAGQQIIFLSNIKIAKLYMDRNLLKNILYHLLLNAIKYSPENTTIYCQHQLINEQLILEIKDEGMGIPINDQPHLFSKFFRGSNADHIPGTGLGLTIVQRYLDLLGGSISFVSVPGQGTTFSIHIP